MTSALPLLRSSLRVLPLSLSLLAGCQCDGEVTEVPGNISGKVCDDQGRPLVSAALALEGRASREGLSSTLGEYSFDRLLPGNYTVRSNTLRRELHDRGALDAVEDRLADLNRTMQRFVAVHQARVDHDVLAPIIDAMASAARSR